MEGHKAAFSVLCILMATAGHVASCSWRPRDDVGRGPVPTWIVDRQAEICDLGRLEVCDMPSNEEWFETWGEEAWKNAIALLTTAEPMLCEITEKARYLFINGMQVRFAIHRGWLGSAGVWDSERNDLQFSDIKGGSEFLESVNELLRLTECAGVMSPRAGCDSSAKALMICWSDRRLINSKMAYLLQCNRLPDCYSRMGACIGEVRRADGRLLRSWWFIMGD